MDELKLSIVGHLCILLCFLFLRFYEQIPVASFSSSSPSLVPVHKLTYHHHRRCAATANTVHILEKTEKEEEEEEEEQHQQQ